MNHIKISSDAKKDIEESAKFYERLREGLGIDFLDKFEEALERINHNHEQFPKIYKDVRKALVDLYPFLILFIVKIDMIIVFAVFHTSRKPGIWKKRLNKEK
jgi:hypothetical protein